MKKTTPVRAGRIIPHGVKPEPHELDTILFYTNQGEDVELIPESHTPGVRRPDFYMKGLAWEVKGPTISQKRTVERAFYSASHQSSNIIMDLRRVKGDGKSLVTLLEKCFKNTRRIRNMHIITKEGNLKVYKK